MKVDNWAIGILIYEFLSGNVPFISDTVEETRKLIIKANLKFPKDFPE